MPAFGIRSFSIASRAAPLPLDLVAGAWGAWSVYRKLRAAYAGSLIRIRRSGDNAETDIGVSGGFLDQAAIAAHCTTNNGFIVRVYDNTTNGRDLIQTADTTRQPQIYNGSIVLLGSTGRPIALFDGSNDTIKNATLDATFIQPATLLDVMENDTWVSTRSLSDGFTINSSLVYQFGTANQLTQFAGANATNTTDDFGLDTLFLATAKFDGANSYIRKNKLTRPPNVNPGTSGPAGRSIGARGDGSLPAACRWSEGFAYPSALSDANQDLLANNITAAFAIP